MVDLGIAVVVLLQVRRVALGTHEVPVLVRTGPEQRIARRDAFNPDKECDKAAALGARLVTLEDAEYPAPLRGIYDPPLVLYVRGTLEQGDSRAVAVVGTRRPTLYGRDTAQRFAGQLARMQLVIVSGLAEGIDTVAHRAALDAGHIEIWADIKKKHSSHAVTGDMTLRETAEGAAFFNADGVVVTGGMTGQPASVAELESIHDLPLRKVVGSGVTPANVQEYAAVSGCLIVGSALKHGGDWRGEVDPDRVETLVRTLHAGE